MSVICTLRLSDLGVILMFVTTKNAVFCCCALVVQHERSRIVLFFHVPFPTSEIFRTLSNRSELLDGMLSAGATFH